MTAFSHVLRTTLMAGALAFAGASAASATDVRVASHMSMTGQPLAHAEIFMEEVENRFPGEFDASFYPSSQLGQERALISQVRAGTLELAAVGSGPLALDPKLGVFDLPWLFADWDHAQRAIDGDLGEAIREVLEAQNMVVLGIYGLDFRHVVLRPGPVVTPEDMEGLNIRVTGSNYRVDAFAEMGASPVPVQWSETFSALQTGVVDGAEATHAGFYEERLHEVAPYLSLTNHVFGPTFLLASRTFFDSLSEDQQDEMRQIGRDISDRAFERAQEISNEFRDLLAAEIEINEVDGDAFLEKAGPIHDAYISENGQEWVDLVNAVR